MVCISAFGEVGKRTRIREVRANLNLPGVTRDHPLKVKIVDGAGRLEVHDGLVMVLSEERSIGIAVVHLSPGEFVTIDEEPSGQR
jgi:hypothetical protein